MKIFNVFFIIFLALFNSCIFSGTMYDNITANVRIGDPIPIQEYLYRMERYEVVKKAQEEFLETTLSKDDVLEIAFSCSGGGWRAMCCSTGFISGADHIGLLDTAMYVSALSGSTWFLAPWIYSGVSIKEYRKRVIDIASNGLKIKNNKEFFCLMDNIWLKINNLAPINIVDFYAALLANSLLRQLGGDPHKVYISDQKKKVDSGLMPMPIYTAILAEKGFPEHIFEFTPYEVGARHYQSYIPTWAFGRKFNNGKSSNFYSEEYMGFMLGIFGSAFAADFKEVYDAAIKDVKSPLSIPVIEGPFNIVKTFIGNLANDQFLKDIRLFWAKTPNFIYNLLKDELSTCPGLKLADAGVSMDNPVFATYRRPPHGDAPDIIFVFDSSASLNFNELEILSKYAKEHSIKFPEIQEYNVQDYMIRVFDAKDISIPVIVYMPIVNGVKLLKESNIERYYFKLLYDFDIKKAIDKGFAHTFNFNYTKKQAETLVAMTEFNIIYCKDVIKKVLSDRIEFKRTINKSI